MGAGDLIPLLMPLGEHVKAAVEYARTQRPDKDGLTLFLQVRLQPWAPKIGGKVVVDQEGRTDLARFLAGVILKAV